MTEGWLYLLHFARPYYHAQHYLGWSRGYRRDVCERIDRHLAGQGSPLVRAALAAGIKVELAALWMGGRKEERQLKVRSRLAAHCPLCQWERKLDGLPPRRR